MEIIEKSKDLSITNTDPKPLIFYFNDDSNSLINIFFSKIKPMEGIVKYKMVNWEKFPKTLEEAKKLSMEWVGLFNTNKLYQGLKVIIYFHLDKKTIRFELKKNNTSYVSLEKDSNVLDVIMRNNYEQNNLVLFDCIKTNYFDPLNIDNCKELGKNISFELEKKYSDIKFIVFLNLKNKSIKITTM
jgi:hypothetical protein